GRGLDLRRRRGGGTERMRRGRDRGPRRGESMSVWSTGRRRSAAGGSPMPSERTITWIGTVAARTVTSSEREDRDRQLLRTATAGGRIPPRAAHDPRAVAARPRGQLGDPRSGELADHRPDARRDDASRDAGLRPRRPGPGRPDRAEPPGKGVAHADLQAARLAAGPRPTCRVESAAPA